VKHSLATVTLGLEPLPELSSAAFTSTCQWYWQQPKYVVASCQRNNGHWLRTTQDMNLGVRNGNGVLEPGNNGNAFL
ncbi:hypothetical protein QBC44DRAFT_219340, partial [Cladorrhinum sp. PSN332]